MVFSSVIFLFYFLPIFMIVYHLLPHGIKNYWALLASLLFYAWGAPVFVFTIIGVIIIDFYIVKYINISSHKPTRQALLALSIILKLVFLVYFKYANFFIDNINVVFESIGVSSLHWVKVIMPIGISFFTFQAITYSVDVYRGVHQPLKKVTDYLLYIFLFPQLIAGPIVLFSEIADDLEDRKKNENYENKLMGFFRFVIGLSKKVLVANVLAVQADYAFSLAENDLNSTIAWVGIFAYTFQIYFDFSGYSDMAIGLGRMMGFKFPENFDNPYISQNITEFWRRWHMTLGRFMRNYLYIPLGGNKVSVKRLYFNLAFVFIVSGFWHGAAWNFILWGAFHGLFLILDRLFLVKLLEKLGKIPAIIFTFFLTLIGWVIFRAESLSQVGYYIKTMFIPKFEYQYYDNQFWAMLVLAMLFGFITAFGFGRKLQQFFFYTNNLKTTQLSVYFGVVVVLFILSTAGIVASGFNPFIYYRF